MACSWPATLLGLVKGAESDGGPQEIGQQLGRQRSGRSIERLRRNTLISGLPPHFVAARGRLIPGLPNLATLKSPAIRLSWRSYDEEALGMSARVTAYSNGGCRAAETNQTSGRAPYTMQHFGAPFFCSGKAGCKRPKGFIESCSGPTRTILTRFTI